MIPRHEMDVVCRGARRWLDTLLLLVSFIVMAVGCGGGSTSTMADVDPAGLLERSFSAHAGRVLRGNEGFVASKEGFTLPIQGDPAALLRRRGGLSASLPKRGNEELRFHAVGGLDVRVRESGAEGEGTLAGSAVAYGRRGGTSFWTATEDGYEEWLMLGPGVATGREPVATWEVEGATVREGPGGIEIAGPDGATKIRVTAPIAFAESGRVVPTRLGARGSRIELWADAGGEVVLVDPVWSGTTSMSDARYWPTATLLGNGKVLVAGGLSGATYLATAELYDPSTGTWSAAGSMTHGRYFHRAVLLSGGKVLVMGGVGASGGSLATAELYDPVTNTWSLAATMLEARYYHSAVVLDGGNVMVAGGYGTSSSLSSAEIYSPANNQWTATLTSMGKARFAHTATRLITGSHANKVLVTGGYSGSAHLDTAELYDPSTSTWQPAGSMSSARSYHAAVLLQNGNVLVMGGGNASSSVASAQIYNTSGSWVNAGTMISARQNHAATLLGSGKVLVVGGTSGSSYLATAEVFDPSRASWASAGSLLSERAYHAILTFPGPNGKVLVAGGYNGAASFSSVELFDPYQNSWTSTTALGGGRSGHTETLITGGKVLITGGSGTSSPLSSATTYDPVNNAWSPAGSMHANRTRHRAVPVSDASGNSKVLVTGGHNGTSSLADVDLYDVAANAWQSPQPPAMQDARADHTATLLDDGKVLVAGGVSSVTWLSSAQRYDPVTNGWVSTQSMPAARSLHSATLLGNGLVLVAGGLDASSSPLSTAVLYDRATNTWTPTGALSVARSDHRAIKLSDGRVLIAGGFGATSNALTSAEIYDPSSGTWSPAGSTSFARTSHAIALLPTNDVLVIGGHSGSGSLFTAEVYDTSANLWALAASMGTARSLHSATVLANGQVLVAGGANASGLLASSELYSPVVIDDGNPCTRDDWDTVLGQVTHAWVTNGTACDDHNPCTQTDACHDGTCVGGNPVVCPGADECHWASTCDPQTGQCSDAAKANGTACNDGSACTVNDVCVSGVCTGASLPAGVSCSNGDPCDGAEKCDGAGQCQGGIALPNGVSCGGDPCQPRTCSAGQCVAGAALPDGAPCEDGSPCKVGAVCSQGVCQASSAASCDDGDPCNGVETCQSGVCVPGDPPVVADADPGTTQTCDPATGVVTTTPWPTIDKTAPSDVASANAGLLSSAIDAGRAAVLLGLVTKSDGATPIPNVNISVVGAPELGTVKTALDGHFVMAVNGGGTVRVRYEKAGYVTVDRPVETRWKDYSWLPDVAMTPLDSMVTSVHLDHPVFQSMRGSLVQDLDGVRRATVLIPPGTTAVVVKTVNGSTTSTPLTSGTLALRATELTVGPNGLNAMPAPLPPSTAYTYAVELSADEALDADTIQFLDAQTPPQPQRLWFYVDNFINFPVGAPVPMGYYDRRTGVWVPSPDGVVVQVLGDPSGSGVKLATKLVNGVPTEPDAAEADELGITPDELDELASLEYVPGQTLWRVPITHFTPEDANWPYGMPGGACSGADDACQPPAPLASAPKPSDGCTGQGSLIECQGQVLREAMPLVGTPHGLHYASDRAPGRREAYRLTIPLVGTVPLAAKLRRIELTIQVAGKLRKEQFQCPCDDLPPYVFEWDGVDVFGRRTQGAQPASYSLSYVYEAEYQAARGSGASFGGGPSMVVTSFWNLTNRSQNEVSGVRRWHGTLGTWDERGAGLGGWSVDVHHVYDPMNQALYRGDGSRRAAADIAPTISSIVGGGRVLQVPPYTKYEGSPASDIYIHRAEGVAAAPDGSVYFVDSGLGMPVAARVGVLRRTGEVETKMALPTLQGPIALGPDGSLFVVTASSGGTRYRVEKIDATGIHPVAGNGCVCGTTGGGNCDPGETATPCDFEGDALSASLGGVGSLVSALSLGPDGSLYIADGLRVRRVSPDGKISNFAGTGQCISTAPVSARALHAHLGFVGGVFAAPDGNVYVSSWCSNVPGAVRVVTPDGMISTVVGGAGADPSHTDDGWPALSSALSDPGPVTLTRDGLIVFDDGNGYGGGRRLRMVDRQGVVVSLAPGSAACSAGFCGDGWPAVLSSAGIITGLSVAPDGSILIASRGGASRILRIASPLPQYGFGAIQVPSEDGNEVYEFDHTGRHLTTRYALTDAVRYQFGYSGGKLVSITDAATQSLETTIDYSIAAQPRVIGPFGDVTRLALDSNGSLQSLARNGAAAGQPDDVYLLAASADGLLTSLRDPVGNEHQFHYDTAGAEPTGRLTQDDDPGTSSPHEQIISVSSTTNASQDREFIVTHTKEQQSGTYQTKYSITVDKKGNEERKNTFAGISTIAKYTKGKDGIQIIDMPDGTTVWKFPNVDPRFNLLAPTFKTTTTLPGNQQGAPALSQTVDVKRLFDAQGLLHQTTTLNGTKTTDIKVLADNQTMVYSSPGGRTWTVVVDAHGRVVGQDLTKLGLGTASVSYSDAYGRLGTTSRTAGARTRSVTRAYYPSNNMDGTSGRLATIAEVDGLFTRSVSFDAYDRVGRVLAQTLPGGRQLGFEYDANGYLTQLRPPPITPQYGSSSTLQAEHHFSPTGLGFLASYWVNDATATTTQLALTSYSYTPDRLLQTVERPEQDSVELSSSNGRLDQMDLPAISVPALSSVPVVPSESVVLTYEGATGRLQSVANGSETLAFGYNGRLMTDVTWTGPVSGTLARTYDADFAVSSETVAGVPLHVARDLDGLPTCIGSAPVTTTCTSGAGGLLSLAHKQIEVDSVTYPTFLLHGATLVGTSIADAYTYNAFGEVEDYVAERPNQEVYYQAHYDRLAFGRIAERWETIEGVSRSYAYTYDDAGRLTDVDDGSSIVHYDYDANGNRLRRVVDGVVVEEGEYDVQDRQTSYGGRSFTYTASGQLASATVGSQTTYYVYDALGNLRHVRLPDGTRIDYVIDGLGRRVGKKIDDKLVSGWLYSDQLRVAAEIDYDSLGQVVAVKRFAYGTKANVPDLMIQGSARYRIFSDHLGSPRIAVDDSGAVVGRWDYDEFGRMSVMLGNAVEMPFGFAGGLYDSDADLVLFGVRSYDALTGRWTAKDPIRFGGTSTNLYQYANSDPVNLRDANGLIPIGGTGEFEAFPQMRPEALLYDPAAVSAAMFSPHRLGEDPDLFQVFSHGESAQELRTQWGIVDAAFVANWIALDPNYRGQGIQLNVCLAGCGDESLAAELSALMGVVVKAPNGYVRGVGWVDGNGGWRYFYNRKIVDVNAPMCE